MYVFDIRHSNTILFYRLQANIGYEYWIQTHQSEGPEHRQSIYIGQAELHQTEADDDAVKDVPALLEVVVRVQGDYLEAHLGGEDAREHLQRHRERNRGIHQAPCW